MTTDGVNERQRDRELADRAADGDRAAFGELLRVYQARTYSIVLRMVGRRDVAAELTQDAFVQAFGARHKYDRERPFRPWLFKIAINVCRNHLRSASRREYASELNDGASPIWGTAPAPPDEAAVAGETARQLERHLAALPEKDRALLLLRYTEELTYAELKQVYGVPESVLKMRVHRAIKKLRALVEGALQ